MIKPAVARFSCKMHVTIPASIRASYHWKGVCRAFRNFTTQAIPLKFTDPFAPSIIAVNPNTPSLSKRDVTVPNIPELHLPFDDVVNTLLSRAGSVPPVKEEEAATPAPSSPFMDALEETSNETVTWNQGGAFESTLDSTLDAFVSLNQATQGEDIGPLLQKSWDANPDLTLRLIWNLRSIHEGKSAKEPFYKAYAWLYENHPKTAILNLHNLVGSCIKRTINIKRRPTESGHEDGIGAISKEEVTEDDPKGEAATETVIKTMSHGYWKDLLNILLLAVTDELVPITRMEIFHRGFNAGNLPRFCYRKKQQSLSPDATYAIARRRRDRIHRLLHIKLVKKLNTDKKFRALYITVARLFADGLSRDVKILQEIADVQTQAQRRIDLSFNLSLVGKWAPSISGSHDRFLNISTAIAALLYTAGELPLKLGTLEESLTTDVAHKLRSAYTRWVISPLRRFLQIPEIAMSTNQWDNVDYTRVPSICMQRNKTHFQKHDTERFSQYLFDVSRGTKKISGATLYPHDILCDALRASHQRGDEGIMNAQVAEGQWKTLVERVKELGTLDSSIAICDVSGSMGDISGFDFKCVANAPIFPALAFSILLAQIARPPWGNAFITFSASPSFVTINPVKDGLIKTARKMSTAEWGMNTDFNAVFRDLILKSAIDHQLKPEDMVKRLFVFTDMQFDVGLDDRDADHKKFKSEHQKVKELFKRHGYELPEIVYWNLSGHVPKPVTKNDDGVALMSGMSPGLLNVFMDGAQAGEIEMSLNKEGKEVKKRLSPVESMVKALTRESYSGLKVID